MQKLLYIILIELISSGFIFSQDIQQVRKFADNQFNLSNYKSALKEYQRVLFFDKEKNFGDVYFKIATINYLMSDFNEAHKYFDLAYKVETNDSTKFELVLKKTLCNLKQENFLLALYDLYDLPDYKSEILEKKQNLYFGICYFGLDDYPISINYFSRLVDSSGVIQIKRLFDEYIRFKGKYNPQKAELLSRLFPGLGQVYIGEIGNGLNSLALLSVVFYYALYTASNYGYIDGMLILSSWFYRYYVGGHNNAKILAENKTSKEKGHVYTEILKIIENNEIQ